MNILLIKQTAIFSAILGAVLGILTVIPFVGYFSFLILMTAVSVIVMIYMKQNNYMGILDLQEGALIGGLTGFVSFLMFSVAYIPINIVLSLLIKSYFSFLPYFFSSAGGFFVMIVLVIFMAIISALMNGFSGVALSYLYEILLGMKKEENKNVEFEIK